MNRRLYKAACYNRLVKLARASRLLQEIRDLNNMEKEAGWADRWLVPGGYYRAHPEELRRGIETPGETASRWGRNALHYAGVLGKGALKGLGYTAAGLTAPLWLAGLGAKKLVSDGMKYGVSPGGYYRANNLVPGTNIPTGRGQTPQQQPTVVAKGNAPTQQPPVAG